MNGIEQGLVPARPGMNPFQVNEVPEEEKRSIRQQMAVYQVPGLGLAIINDFQIAFRKSYGIREVGKAQAIDDATIFQGASTSKLVVATIALNLVDRGILELNRDVNQYLESWQVPDNEFTQAQKVTLELLLTHQAGFPETNFPYDEEKGVPTLAQVLKGELPAQNKPARVGYAPGTEWTYSNIGYVVIQQILEDTLDKPLPQIAQEIVFEPLEMTSSTYVYPLEGPFAGNEAMPHDARGVACEPAMCPTALAQGGLMTTPQDLAILMIELMSAYAGRSEKLLSRQMAHRMLTPLRDIVLSGVPCKQGLGVFLFGEGQDVMFFHPGQAYPGSTSWPYAFLQRGMGAVIMANGDNGFPLTLEIIAAITNETLVRKQGVA